MGKQDNAGRFESGYLKVTTENLTSWNLPGREKAPIPIFRGARNILYSGSSRFSSRFPETFAFSHAKNERIRAHELKTALPVPSTRADHPPWTAVITSSVRRVPCSEVKSARGGYCIVIRSVIGRTASARRFWISPGNDFA